jgi:chorismate mutase
MTSSPARDLEELRHRVDSIDKAIVDLLGERLGVVAEIARVKQAADEQGLALRPAREALVMRRLLGHAAGRFPPGTLVRLWRELFGAMTRAQSALTVSVFVPNDQPELWDVARDHFGSLTPIERARSAEEALRRAADEPAHLAVLPLPGEADRWWMGLGRSLLRVQARLPFAPFSVYPGHVQGLVLARLPPEPTGDDLTLLALETDRSLSARELDALGPGWSVSCPAVEGGGARHLVELEGYLEAESPALSEALAPVAARVLRVQVLGCYARPLPAALFA